MINDYIFPLFGHFVKSADRTKEKQAKNGQNMIGALGNMDKMKTLRTSLQEAIEKIGKCGYNHRE